MPFSTRTMRTEDWAQSKHFTRDAFRHPDKMGYEFVMWLNEVRTRAGVPMSIVSDYRDPVRNKKVGGAADSAHTDVPCEAVDIRKKPTPGDPNWNHGRWRIMRAAMELGCQRIGLYPSGSLHLDRTEDRRAAPRLWVAVDNPA